MNDITTPNSLSDVPWPTSDHRMPVPDTSMLPGTELPRPAAAELLNDAVQGAHDTIDRLADGAAPAVRHLGERLSAAEEAVQAKAAQWRHTRDAWADSTRSTVRANPLLAVAAALALGAVVARLTRGARPTRAARPARDAG